VLVLLELLFDLDIFLYRASLMQILLMLLILLLGEEAEASPSIANTLWRV